MDDCVYLWELDYDHPIFEDIVKHFPYLLTIDTKQYGAKHIFNLRNICCSHFGNTVSIADMSLLVKFRWVYWDDHPYEKFAFKTQEDLLLIKMSI